MEPCEVRVVIRDASRDELVVVVVSEPFKQRAKLVGREKVEEHHHISLFGDLVAVRAVSFGLEEAIEALDVAVLVPIGLPVKFFEHVVALELGDHTVVETHPHLAAHAIPTVELLVIDFEPLPQVANRRGRECVEDVKRGDRGTTPP